MPMRGEIRPVRAKAQTLWSGFRAEAANQNLLAITAFSMIGFVATMDLWQRLPLF